MTLSNQRLEKALRPTRYAREVWLLRFGVRRHRGDLMLILNRTRNCLLTAFVVIVTQVLAVSQPLAQTQPISIVIVRHAETDTSQPTLPLTAAGRQRAALLAQTLRGVKFTHIFTSHNTRARLLNFATASAGDLPIDEGCISMRTPPSNAFEPERPTAALVGFLVATLLVTRST